MAFYHEIITEKSWEELKKLQRTVAFVLIGGWATYLYTKALKSKDIDIVVDFDQLPVLGKHYVLSKNDRLRKYEAVKGEVQIDVYLPHYSQLGIPVDDLMTHTRSLEGFTVLAPDYLLALKIFVLAQRARSAKGEKDFLDLLLLIDAGVVKLPVVASLLHEHRLQGPLRIFLTVLQEHTEVPALSISAHRYAKLKKTIVSGLNAPRASR